MGPCVGLEFKYEISMIESYSTKLTNSLKWTAFVGVVIVKSDNVGTRVKNITIAEKKKFY